MPCRSSTHSTSNSTMGWLAFRRLIKAIAQELREDLTDGEYPVLRAWVEFLEDRAEHWAKKRDVRQSAGWHLKQGKKLRLYKRAKRKARNLSNAANLLREAVDRLPG